MAAREDERRRGHAEHRAVKGKSTVPDRECVQWIAGVVARIVDEDVHEPRAEQHANDEISNEAVETALVEWRQSPTNPPTSDRDADRVADHIHQAVPTQGERPNAEQ